jgi:hypothetical protein
MTHKNWSYLKSIVRFIGYISLGVAAFGPNMHLHLLWAAIVLSGAEVLGIVEEKDEVE